MIMELPLSDLRFAANTAVDKTAQKFIGAANDVSFTYIRQGDEAIRVRIDQLWFWNEEWQEGERRVDEYIRDGNVQSFNSMEEFLRDLQE